MHKSSIVPNDHRDSRKRRVTRSAELMNGKAAGAQVRSVEATYDFYRAF